MKSGCVEDSFTRSRRSQRRVEGFGPILKHIVADNVGASVRCSYRQERIRLNGEPFRMYKFRSMRPNADKELAALLAAQGTSEKPLTAERVPRRHEPRRPAARGPRSPARSLCTIPSPCGAPW